jgi:hypothetical protein
MPEIRKVRYTHDGMIDMIIAEPWISQNELAAHFGYSPSWISIVMSSDAFKDRLKARRGEIVDPRLIADVETRLEAIARQSAKIVLEKLEAAPTPEFALKALEASSKAMGFGARTGLAVNVNGNASFVVAMPTKAADGAQWLEQYGGQAHGPEARAKLERHADVVTIEGEVNGMQEEGRGQTAADPLRQAEPGAKLIAGLDARLIEGLDSL